MAKVRAYMETPARIRHVALFGVDGQRKERLVAATVGSERSSETANVVAAALGHHRTHALLYEGDDSASYLVNLTTTEALSPSSVSSAAFTTMLQLSDGAIVVLDCSTMELSEQARHQLKQSVLQRVQPTIALDIGGHAWSDLLERSSEASYQAFTRLIDEVNEVITRYGGKEEASQLASVSAQAGSVAFVSIERGWGFSVPTFARKYATEWGTSEATAAERLWGDWGLDPESDEWVGLSSSATAKRGFCQFVLEPVLQVAVALRSGDEASSSDLSLTAEELGLDVGFAGVLPISDVVLQLAVNHLPSPVVAQPRRGMPPLADNEDSSRVVMLASLLEEQGSIDGVDGRHTFCTLGRVLSGRLVAGQRVKFTRYCAGGTEGSDAWDCVKTVTSTMAMGQFQGSGLQPPDQTADGIPAGNFGAFVCEDVAEQTAEAPTHTVWLLASAASPVLRVTIMPARGFDGSQEWNNDSKKIKEVVHRVVSRDPTLTCDSNPFEDPTLAAPDEQRLEPAICQVQAECNALGVAISISRRPAYREAYTKSGDTTPQRMSKSQNRINRVYSRASLISDDTMLECLSNDFGSSQAQELTELQVQRLDLDKQLEPTNPRKVWACFPSPGSVNLLVDHSRYGTRVSPGVWNSMVETFPPLLKGFVVGMSSGVLCGEPSHGLRVDFDDVHVDWQERRRRPNQLMFVTRRAVHAAQLSFGPILEEPVYLVHIAGCPDDAREACCSELESRGGAVVSSEREGGVDAEDIRIQAYVAVRHALGLAAQIREITHSLATVRFVFDHYRAVPGDPLDENTQAGAIVRALRVEKELPPQVPSMQSFDDVVRPTQANAVVPPSPPASSSET
ncbi:hypothetical protein BBJ28_00014180 [Nothophytophthora sp. Chile5]|nr:hypothetical protein BBJ28_00014180 [Nothophytophthora sp. Chile5]